MSTFTLWWCAAKKRFFTLLFFHLSWVMSEPTRLNCMRRVTWPINGGDKNYPHVSNALPEFTYSLIHYLTYSQKLSHIICRITAFFPLRRLESSPRMRSVTWPVHRGPPKTTSNIFFTMNYIFAIQHLSGFDDDHSRTLVPAVLKETSHAYGNGQNSSRYKIQTPQPITIKVYTIDYVHETNSQPKFVTNRPWGSVWANTWIILFYFLYLLLFFPGQAY